MTIIYSIASYLLGSLSMAYLMGKFKGVDLKNSGSGNLGTTNAIRVLGIGAGVITLLFDFLKGFLPVFLLENFVGFDKFTALAVGSFAIIGHDFPIFLKFKGGKGVATSLGAFAAFAPLHGLYAAIFFVCTFFITKIMSLSVLLTSAIIMCFYLYLAISNGKWEFMLPVLIVALMIVRHRANIERLLKGEEKKLTIGGKK